MPKSAQVSSNCKISSKKNVINRIKNTALWNKNTTNYRTHSITHNHKKNLQTRGPRGASNKKKFHAVSRRPVPNQRGRSTTTTKWQPHSARPRSITGRQGKADDIDKDTTNDNPVKSKENRRSRSRQKKKTSTKDRNKPRPQSQAKKTTIQLRRGPKENTTPQRLFYPRNHPNLVIFRQTISPSISRLHTKKKQPAKNLRSLLGLGLKFIPTPRCTNTWTKLKETSMPKLQRAIHLRFHFAGSETSSNDTYDPKIYVRSNWTPPYWTLPPIVLQQRLDKFATTLNKLFKRTLGKTNLLSYQARALQSLQKQQDFLICPCDKNLGPAIIERDDYIKIAMIDHLLDGRTYRRLSEADCNNHKQRLIQEIKSWFKQYNKTLTKMERAFLKQGLDQNKRAFAGFYLTLKAHKLKPGQNVTHLKSRPIVSCPGSMLHPLDIWTDHKLQSLAKQQISYFCNSFDLRQELCSTQYPTTAQLFTADAVSMYTNIPTNTAIMLIARHLRKKIPEERPKQNEAMIVALKLVMLNNIFSFGDMTFKQLNGTAMGTPPAPPYATIYYGLHESTFLPSHRQHVIFYKRFIDDVFGIWLPHPNAELNERLWDEFTKTMNNYPGLTWEFNKPSHRVVFMDLTISI